MGRPGTRARTFRIHTDALLVRKAPFGEADVIATLFSEERGTLSVIARAARRSQRRFPALEPMHLLRVTVDERAGAEMGTLVEATIARPRVGLSSDLERLEAAGKALRWVRSAAPPHTPEPALWAEVNGLLDDLDEPETLPGSASSRVAAMGLRLLVAVGWGLDLERCVRCGRTCAKDVSACVAPGEGGLICRACGGAPTLLRSDRRARLLDAVRGEPSKLGPADIEVAFALVDAALEAHGGLSDDRARSRA